MGENVSYKRLRLRELKRDFMFGIVLRNHGKTLKSNGLQDFNIVLQVLPNEEELNEDDIVLVMKARDSANRLYLDQREFIFKASKVPTLKEMKDAILAWKELELPDEELRVFKYYLHDLEWVEWSDKSYRAWVERKERGNKAKVDQKAKQKEEKNKDNKKKDNKKEENKKKEK